MALPESRRQKSFRVAKEGGSEGVGALFSLKLGCPT